MSYKEIIRENYKVVFETPELYVDNQKRKRSGHMTHAMARFGENSFIDFNSNCSGTRANGHSAFGWVEYRISNDGGKSYSEPYELECSKECFNEGLWTFSVEKAVACDDGTIVAICHRNTTLEPNCCEPWLSPMCIRSTDGGKSWSEPYVCIPYAGRVYDMVYKDGTIYAMINCNEHFLGTTDEHKYRLYVSTNKGESFEERSVVKYETTRRHGYCSLLFDTEGTLHAYAYNEANEHELSHSISRDRGFTWEISTPCAVKYTARNPQTALIDGVYILHARAENHSGFVFYTSLDGYNWDEGTYFSHVHGSCHYSNNLNLKDEKGNFLLVQYSEVYEAARVNVMHVKLRIEKPSLKPSP